MDEAELVRDSNSEQQSWMPIGIADKRRVFYVFVKLKLKIDTNETRN